MITYIKEQCKQSKELEDSDEKMKNRADSFLKLHKEIERDYTQKGKSGICMPGAGKQKSWLSDQAFAKKYGFETVDSTEDGYELLALSFDGTTPSFTEHARKQQIKKQELTIYYTMQCPFILQKIEGIQKYCSDHGVKVAITAVDSLEKDKSLPCVFNNWGVFYKGKFETVNLLDAGAIEKILKSRKS